MSEFGDMERWRSALRENHDELAKQLRLGDFNGVLDEMWAKYKLSEHERDRFYTTNAESENQKKEKVRGFVKYLREKLSEDTLKVFYGALLKFEYTEAAKLIEQYLS